MIICMDETVRIGGDKVEVLVEATCILNAVYEKLVEHEGEESAEEQLRKLFMLAIMSKEEVREAVAELQEGDTEAVLLGEEPSRMLS